MIIEINDGDVIVSTKEYEEKEFNFFKQKEYDGLIMQAISDSSKMFINSCKMLQMHGVLMQDIEQWTDEELIAFLTHEIGGYNKKK